MSDETVGESMKKIFVLVLLFAILSNVLNLYGEPTFQAENKKKVANNLSSKYKEWLDLVFYIITPDEKAVFKELKNKRERDAFINLFWKMRDPSKGTPKNEYKEEHIRRFKYVNRYYKYGSLLPGWKTDRGRIYIILGPPVSREEIVEQNGIHPIEIWEYFGDAEKGLPTAFRMVFYKKNGVGGFRQYVPAYDGPASLLRTEIGKINVNNNLEVYRELKRLNPVVADISLSLIPGELTMNYSPSLHGPILMSKVYDYPKMRINTAYAKDFLKFKGVVKVYSNLNYFNTKYDVYLQKDPVLGLNFVHIALQPGKISVGYLEEQEKYYLSLNMTVILKKGEKQVLKYKKKFPLYYTKEELDETISHGLIIMEHFPVINGKFNLQVILQNPLNREISFIESKIDTTKIDMVNKKKSNPVLYKPFISYKINYSAEDLYRPFRIMNKNIKIDPKRNFGLKDSLTTLFCVEKGKYDKRFKVEMEVENLEERNKYKKLYSFNYPNEKTIWFFTKNLDRLKYGNYILRIRLIGENGKILSRSQNDFQVSPLSNLPHPPQVFTIRKKENCFMFYMRLAKQYQHVRDDSNAELFYKKAFSMNASHPALIKNYASFLIGKKKYDQALSVIDNLRKDEKEMFNYLVLKGRIFYSQQRYQSAIHSLQNAYKIYDSDFSLLNTLGIAYLKVGKEQEALMALSASLKINRHQKRIKKLMQILKNSGKGYVKPHSN